jgi:uncharacterized membrane protein
MAAPRPRHRRAPPRLKRFFQARWRLLISVLLGAAAIVLVPTDLRIVSRPLIGWDAGVALYLVLVLWMIAHSDSDRVRRESAL